MKEVKLTDKNSQRVQQLFVEKQKVDQLFEHTVLTILDASNVDYANKKVRVAEDFKSIVVDEPEEIKK